MFFNTVSLFWILLAAVCRLSTVPDSSFSAAAYIHHSKLVQTSFLLHCVFFAERFHISVASRRVVSCQSADSRHNNKSGERKFCPGNNSFRNRSADHNLISHPWHFIWSVLVEWFLPGNVNGTLSD